MILKGFRKHLTSKILQTPINNNNLFINSSKNKNLNIKHTVSIKRNTKYKKEDITTIKVNQSANTKFLNKNNNNCYEENYKNKEINDINITTIYSNGKFRNNKKHFKNNIRKKLYDKNIVLSNYFINNKLNKKLSLKLVGSNSKKNYNNNWKGLNISSHYLGNIKDNKFGVVTNKYFVNKNIILTCSQNNLKLKQNYDTTSIIVERNNKNKNKEFKTINIPNHNNYFNGIGTTNFFPRIENVISNEKLYKKLMEQMTVVFKNKVKEYSLHKSNEKNNTIISPSNSDYFRKSINSIKQKKLFNYEHKGNKKSSISPKHGESGCVYKVITIKNMSKKNSHININ